MKKVLGLRAATALILAACGSDFVWNMFLWPVLIISDQDKQVVQVAL